MSNNLQYRRTHKAIIEAFIKLTNIKNFETITIADIMEEALVSRFTFYKHFKDKYEIAEILQQEIIEGFEAALLEISTFNSNDPKYSKKLNEKLGEFSFQNKDVFNSIWNIHTDQVDLQNYFSEFFKKLYYNDPEFHLESETQDLEAEIVASVQIIAMKYYMNKINTKNLVLNTFTEEVLINAFIYLAKLYPPENAKEVLMQFIPRYFA